MKKIYIIIGLLFSLSACNNWLDVELDNKVDDSKLFSTPEGFKEALAGVYSEISKANLYGQALTMEYVDLLARYYTYSRVNAQYEYWKDFKYNQSSTKNTIAGFWEGLYRNIGQLNCILEWAEKNNSVLNEAEYNQVCGEALGLGAYLHFDLYRLFAGDVKRSPKVQGIPYNKTFGVSLPPMYTVEEVIQLVINDLKEAEQLLANDPITTVTPYAIIGNDTEIADAASKDQADQYVARMNLYAVKAMLARAYQARGEYTKAIKYAQEVIDSKKFRLLQLSSIDQSKDKTDLLFSDEHIFSLRNRELNLYSQRLHRDNTTASGASEDMKLPFNEVNALYESNNGDVRYSKWFDVLKLAKYTPDSASIFPNKMPMIKLAEMYLLIAECSYNSNPDASLEYINTLRNSRIRDYKPWSYITYNYIIQEMKREYVGEGQMWYVYKRNNLPLPGNGVSGDIAPSDAIYVLPLPDAEIENGHR